MFSLTTFTRWPDNEMLLRNKIVSLSEIGDIGKMMEYLGKARKCDVGIYLTAYSSFVEKGHIAIAMPLLREGLEHYPDDQVRHEIISAMLSISEFIDRKR